MSSLETALLFALNYPLLAATVAAAFTLLGVVLGVLGFCAWLVFVVHRQ